MKVFLSWSQPRSRQLAESLHSLLPRCIQELQPFISSADIEPGANWFNEIGAALDAAEGIGIFVVTPENVRNPWLNFEAGYIASKGGMARVCCLLLGLKSEEVPYPLQAFNHLRAVGDDAAKLLEMLNGRLQRTLSADQLAFAAENFRGPFEAAIAKAQGLPHETKHAPSGPTDQIEHVVASLNRIENSLALQLSKLSELAPGQPAYSRELLRMYAENLGIGSMRGGLLGDWSAKPKNLALQKESLRQRAQKLAADPAASIEDLEALLRKVEEMASRSDAARSRFKPYADLLTAAIASRKR